jgi:hypothetical protein
LRCTAFAPWYAVLIAVGTWSARNVAVRVPAGGVAPGEPAGDDDSDIVHEAPPPHAAQASSSAPAPTDRASRPRDI